MYASHNKTDSFYKNYDLTHPSDGLMIDYNRKLVGLDSWTDDQAQN